MNADPADLPPLDYMKIQSVGHVPKLVLPNHLPFCCEKGKKMGLWVCPECEYNNEQIAKASLGIGPEEKLKRVHEAWSELIRGGVVRTTGGVKFFCLTEAQILAFGTVMEQTGYEHVEDDEN